MIIASKGGNIMNEDNNNNFILVDEDKPKEKKWKKIVKILLVVAIVCSFVMNGYVFYNMMSSSSDSTTTVTNKGTVKQVNYDVKTDTTSVVEKASDSVVGVVVYKNTTNNALDLVIIQVLRVKHNLEVVVGSFMIKLVNIPILLRTTMLLMVQIKYKLYFQIMNM